MPLSAVFARSGKSSGAKRAFNVVRTGKRKVVAYVESFHGILMCNFAVRRRSKRYIATQLQEITKYNIYVISL